MTPCTTHLRIALATCLLATADVALAEEPNPWYIGVNQAVSYNSNPSRLVDEFAEGSWWSSTSLVGGFDQRYGRQRFYANGNVAANVYGQLDQLDNTSYGLTTGWDWATVERLSGTVYASYNQGLANYGGFNQSTLARVVKVTQDNALAYATVDYGLLSLLAADVRVAYSSLRYDSDDAIATLSFDRYELNQTSLTARVRKQFAGQLVGGVGLAYTKGDYFSTGQEFDRYDVFLTGNWTITGQSTISGRIGYSTWDYTGPNPSENNGVTGWLAWRYFPTGKLDFTTRISYDTQANSEITSGSTGSAGDSGGSDWLTAGLQFTARYAFSGKTSFNASLEYYSQSRDGFGIPAGGGAPTFDGSRNTTLNLLLGATWLPSRNWQVNCSLTLSDRNESRDAGSSISLTPYTAYGGSCAAQFLFQ
jgi:hypothetical protein